MEHENWVWDSNVRRFIEWTSRWTGYDFDESDWQAIETGLRSTDADDPNRWFEYPLDGDPRLNLQLAINEGAAPVSIRVKGNADQTLAVRIETLFALLQESTTAE